MSEQIEYAEIRLNDGDGNDYINFYVNGITHSYLLEEVYELLNGKMPCGHLARYAVNGEEGTQYCAMCLNNKSMCSYCGDVREKTDIMGIAEHVITCEKRPEKMLSEIIETLSKQSLNQLEALKIANECINDIAFIAHNLDNSDNQAIAKIKERWMEYPLGKIAQLLEVES